MADSKISALAAKTAAGASDLLVLVDVSDTTMAASGTDKQVTAANLHSPIRTTAVANGSPSDGDLWYDTGTKTLAGFLNGIAHRFAGCLYSQAASVTVANTTTATSLVSTAGAVGSVTLPANFLTVAKTVRIAARGTFTSAGAKAAWSPRLGATTLVTSANQGFLSSATACAWMLDFTFKCVSTGSSGSVIGQGIATSVNGASGTANVDSIAMTSAATVDTTAALAIDLQYAWSVAASGTSLTVNILTITAID